MNDDTFSEAELTAAELAGDALDGSALDGAPVDADLVAAFGALRASLAEAPAASVEVRERALSAAMAAFDAPTADAPAAEAPPATWAPVSTLDRQRNKRMRTITAAAAAVMVFGGVGVFAATRSGGDADSTAINTTAKVEGSPRSGDSLAEAVVPAGDAASASEVGAAPADTTAVADQLSDTTGAAPSTIGSINAPGEVRAKLDSPEALADYVVNNASPTGELQNVCVAEAAADYANSEILGNVEYQGTAAVVVRSVSTGEVAALDLLTCSVLASVPTP
jgi:hypothetical protein